MCTIDSSINKVSLSTGLIPIRISLINNNQHFIVKGDFPDCNKQLTLINASQPAVVIGSQNSPKPRNWYTVK